LFATNRYALALTMAQHRNPDYNTFAPLARIHAGGFELDTMREAMRYRP
jgi:hypothetical protein